MKTNSIIAVMLGLTLTIASSCKKDKEADPVTPTPSGGGTTTTDVNSSYQATFTLDGTAVSYLQSNPNFQIVHSSNNSINTTGGPSTFMYGTFVGVTDTVGLEVDKGTISMMCNCNDPGDSTFYAYFAPATIPYSPNTMNGVTVTYWNGSVMWRSDLGTADQTGSVFKIVGRKDVTTTFSDYTVKVYATFNCKLYDGMGHVKTLTNGVLISSFAKI
jgi:hypothetical protein